MDNVPTGGFSKDQIREMINSVFNSTSPVSTDFKKPNKEVNALEKENQALKKRIEKLNKYNRFDIMNLE